VHDDVESGLAVVQDLEQGFSGAILVQNVQQFGLAVRQDY